ncbi:MAG: 6,7-dimethyl-8-ribityllumazine synthase [Pseudomonadota bacterium]|nr:6,7-dimethyl-8-ribityllumazine synthase [Pseudomonadota bacterium]
MKVITGDFTDVKGRYGLVAGRFNDFITERLVEGANDALRRHGLGEDDIDCVWVPGAFEIPATARALLQRGGYQAVIALGCVIRGATPHFDYVAGQCASGIARLNLEQETPVIFGVLTTDTIEQAIERAGTKAGNKGSEAALTALEMASLLRRLQDR